MLTSIVFIFKHNKCRKKYSFGEAAGKFCKRCLAGLALTFYFLLVAVPAFAASTGGEHPYISPAQGIPIWKLGIMLIELIILGIIWKFIMSDLRVIRWFEKKKKSRL